LPLCKPSKPAIVQIAASLSVPAMLAPGKFAQEQGLFCVSNYFLVSWTLLTGCTSVIEWIHWIWMFFCCLLSLEMRADSSTLPPPTQSTWTPVDSTGFHWTSLYTGPYSQNWTPLDCQTYPIQNWTPLDCKPYTDTNLDSTGLSAMLNNPEIHQGGDYLFGRWRWTLHGGMGWKAKSWGAFRELENIFKCSSPWLQFSWGNLRPHHTNKISMRVLAKKWTLFCWFGCHSQYNPLWKYEFIYSSYLW